MYLTKRTPFNAEQIRLFSATPPSREDAASINRLQIEDIWSETHQPVAAHRWPSLDPQTPQVADSTREWIKQRFYSCGGYTEDQAPL